MVPYSSDTLRIVFVSVCVYVRSSRWKGASCAAPFVCVPCWYAPRAFFFANYITPLNRIVFALVIRVSVIGLSPQTTRSPAARARTVSSAMQAAWRPLLFDRRSLRLFRVCLSVALLLEQLDLLLTGDLYAWIIDGGGVLDRPARRVASIAY